MEMTKYKNINNLDKIDNSLKKLKGKVTRIWTGVRKIEDCSEVEDEA